jgi:hypothetical protein
MVLLLAAVVFTSAVKVHAAWLLPGAPSGWNSKQMAKIPEPGDKFSFAVLGDNKNSIKTFDILKKSLDREDVLFSIDVGDLAFDGEEVKFRLFANQVLGLKAPMLTALGNHDIEAGGLANYERIFGPRYYSFAVGDSYFIVLDDSDGRSVDPHQMRWFESELKKGNDYDHRFVFLHIPPFRGLRNMSMPMREFLSDRKNADEIKHLCVEYAVDYVFGSHMHTFDYDLWPWASHYVITGGGGAELWDVDRFRDMHHYLKITVSRDGVTCDLKPVVSRGSKYIYMYLEEPWVYTYAYIANNYRWLIVVLGSALVLCGVAFAFLYEDRRCSCSSHLRAGER